MVEWDRSFREGLSPQQDMYLSCLTESISHTVQSQSPPQSNLTHSHFRIHAPNTESTSTASSSHGMQMA